MLNRRYYIALGIVVLITLVLLKLPNRATGQLKLALGGFFLPLFGLSASGGHLVEKAANTVLPRSDLMNQLEKVEKENQELRIRLHQNEELSRENDQLRHALGWSKQTRWKLKPVRVVGREPANWWKNVRIDAGSRDGLVGNLPVLTPDGLVGRIGDLTYTQAQVILLGDPDCRVSVMIEDKDAREQGIIAPASSNPLDSTLVELSYLSRNVKLSPGQRVLTSGIGGLFPKGIVVGQIVDWKSVGYGLYTEARVKLQVKVNTLELVWVKMP